MKAIVWQERYSCNFKCPYCGIWPLKSRGDIKASWQDWVAAFNRLKPGVIDITGGEPFLNKNLIDIVNGLETTVAITTNLSQPLLAFAQNVSPRKVISMTLSYHPSMTMTQEAFIGKAILLANRGFHVTVNFVAYPEQMYLIPALKGLFETIGIPFHVDPYAEDNQLRYAYTEKENKFLSQFVNQDRAFRVKDVEKHVTCSGGRDYIQVDPDGFAYRCMTMNLRKEPPIGNILDKTFRLNDKNETCGIGDLCGGCDRDKCTIVPVKYA